MITFGWLSTIFLATCGIPMLYKAYKDGNADGVSALFLLMWILGEIFGLIYVTWLWSLPLIANYLFNLILTIMIARYKFWPRRKHA
jgi:Flp pilus assembly protein TadB